MNEPSLPAATRGIAVQSAAAPFDAHDWLARYQSWRHIVEPGFWIVLFCLQAVVNSLVVWMDIRRVHLNFADWEPVVWESTSHLVVLALVPAVIAMERRFPLQFTTWRRNLRWHLVATIAYSLIHVIAMVALRKVAYITQGAEYDFGHWPRELLYEYTKDVRSYGMILLIVFFYRLLLLRLQGEARLLTAPDAGPPVESIERPERFLVRKLGKEFLLPAAEVEWLQAMGNYVNLRVRNRDYPLRSTMGEIELRLDPSRFARVHRSYIVNLDCVQEIEPMDSGDARAKMRDGGVVPVSRRYRDNLRRF
jgi:DNA-binding LytR/AlgR family response regulator